MKIDKKKLEFCVGQTILWNSLRYSDIIIVPSLCLDLLIEEFNEFEEAYEANDTVECLDAIGDLLFVQAGIMHKVGLSRYKIANCLYEFLDSYKINDDVYLSESLSGFILLKIALEKFKKKFNIEVDLVEVFTIICNSNNTKQIPLTKVSAYVKANIDKGSNYIPPTKFLKELL